MEKNNNPFFANFPDDYSQELQDFVTNVALKKSRYIFVQRKANKQWGYCTHCKKKFVTNKLKHNKSALCNNCNSYCVVKNSGRGRKRLIDEAYVVWYEKSMIDPEAIIARGIHVQRDYSGDYHNVQTEYNVQALYFFKPGESRFFKRSWWKGKWEERKSVFSIINNEMKHINWFYSRKSIAEAVKNTMFQYSQWEQFHYEDMVKFFALYTNYPCIEYLTKIGLDNLVLAKLQGDRMYKAINWRGKSLQKVLRITKQDLKEIKYLKEMNYLVSAYTLAIYQMAKKDKSNMNIGNAYLFSRMVPGYYYEDLLQLKQYAKISQIYRYIEKQYYSKKNFSRPLDVFTTWKDYVEDCKKLNMDISQENILFPTNLYEAHQETIKRIKYKEDLELNRKISARLKKLQQFSFTANGLFIRPARSTKELIEEGNALNHCVGGYAKQYAEGKTDIFVIRKMADPDKPFYTVEIKNSIVVQVRGYKNCDPTEEVKEFMDKFQAEKLIKKNQKVAKIA